MIAGVAGITLLVAACGSSSPSSSAKSKVSAAAHSTKSSAKGSHSANASAAPHATTPKTTSGTATLKAQHTALGTVLATGTGSTLYGFTRDSSTASACTATCAATWHPLTGTPRMAAGTSMPGTLGTITRSGGVRQATFDGHPLYTYKDDTGPGEVKGENELQFGGRWLTIPVASAVTPVAPTGPSKSATPPRTGITPPSHTRSGGAGP